MSSSNSKKNSPPHPAPAADASAAPLAKPPRAAKFPSSESQPRRKSKPLIPIFVQPLGRSSFLTVRDRKRVIEKLPSIARKVPATGSGMFETIDKDALPPQPPAPPPSDGQLHVDCGAPIPNNYGMDRLCALVRSPHWIFVYWDLSGGQLERLRFKYSGDVVDQARWVLRVEATPHVSPRLVDIDVRASCGYVRVAPDCRYCVELGFFTPEGHYESVCRSREVVTPREGLSRVVDERWMVVREDLEKLLQAGGSAAWLEVIAGASERLALHARADYPRAAAFFSGRLVSQQKLEGLSQSDPSSTPPP